MIRQRRTRHSLLCIWDAEEFNFEVVSEDDEPKTDDEDLRLLFQEELEENSDDCFS